MRNMFYRFQEKYLVSKFNVLNCNVGKVNFETSLAGQRLNPRQAGLGGVATGFAGGYM